MVIGVQKPKREKSGSGQQDARTARTSRFGSILEKKAAEDHPEECYTVTYDRQSRLQTYYYSQSREYTW